MDYKEQLEQSYAQEMEKLKANKPNLMIIGASGVGKSSLINRIFGKGMAKVGAGKPVTDRIESYSSPDSLINIFDTMGYETKYESSSADESDKFEENVLAEIEQRKKRSLQEQIHIIWYCISITNHRVFDYDAEQIRRLNKAGITLFIVFTKCDEDSEDDQGRGMTAESFRKTLEGYGLSGFRCFETAAMGEHSFDLDALLVASCDALTDDNLRKAFAVAQIHNIELKSNYAHPIIHGAAILASAAAATPLPCADAPVITGIQMTMAMGLAKLYGFSNLGESAMTLLKTQLVSMLGKQLVASLTKFIPVLGSAINATVAFSLTEALGWALVTVYENVLREYLQSGKEPVWAQVFSSDILATLISQRMNFIKE